MLEAKNLHKIYSNGKGEVVVLKGIDLSIEKGRFVSVVGPSGAGKSTLLHILGGLDSPTQGRVIFEGEDIYRLNDSAISRLRNKKIGFIFQFYHLLSEFTVLENVIMPALIADSRIPAINLGGSAKKYGGKIQESRVKAMELLEQVGLGRRIGYFPNQLSGGEKQRVAIVRALINEPDMLLCDEPTGNLDSHSGSEIISLIKGINTKNAMAVVLVTHNLELAKLADRIYNLRDGILVN